MKDLEKKKKRKIWTRWSQASFLDWKVLVADLQQYGKQWWKLLSRVQLFATPWTIQSMEFSRLENSGG